MDTDVILMQFRQYLTKNRDFEGLALLDRLESTLYDSGHWDYGVESMDDTW
jgi:hypothetical protein